MKNCRKVLKHFPFHLCLSINNKNSSFRIELHTMKTLSSEKKKTSQGLSVLRAQLWIQMRDVCQMKGVLHALLIIFHYKSWLFVFCSLSHTHNGIEALSHTFYYIIPKALGKLYIDTYTYICEYVTSFIITITKKSKSREK
jgi:hypothetical protein